MCIHDGESHLIKFETFEKITKDGSATGLKILQWLQPRVATL